MFSYVHCTYGTRLISDVRANLFSAICCIQNVWHSYSGTMYITYAIHVLVLPNFSTEVSKQVHATKGQMMLSIYISSKWREWALRICNCYLMYTRTANARRIKQSSQNIDNFKLLMCRADREFNDLYIEEHWQCCH